jgi:hypothetical protein
MKIVLKNVSGESITIDVKPEDTFYDLKTRIQNESGIQLDLEQFNFKGKKITDDQIVAEYFFDGLYEFLYMYLFFFTVYIELCTFQVMHAYLLP